MLQETTLKPAAHLTCVDASRERGRRGSPRLLGRRHAPHRGPARRPAGPARAAPTSRAPTATPTPPSWRRAWPRSRRSRSRSGSIPQKHPESPSIEHDIDVLKAKIDAGRDPGDHPVLLRHRRLPALRGAGARGRGSPSRSCPAIMPVTNFKGLRRMAQRCRHRGARLAGQPVRGPRRRSRHAPADRRRVAAEMCARLEEEGFSDFHFYTLNRADLVYAICRVLGIAGAGRRMTSARPHRRAEGGRARAHPDPRRVVGRDAADATA